MGAVRGGRERVGEEGGCEQRLGEDETRGGRGDGLDLLGVLLLNPLGPSKRSKSVARIVKTAERHSDVQKDDLNGDHVGLLVSRLRDYQSGTGVNRELSGVFEDVCCTLEVISE